MFSSYISTLYYMQSLQAQAMQMSRFAPVQIIINNQLEKRIDDNNYLLFNEDKISQGGKISEKSTHEDSSPLIKRHITNMGCSKFSSFRRKEREERRATKAIPSSKYIFNTVNSRKKDKKSLKSRMNRIISRVHNMDCLLKKIKAKYLKYLFVLIKDEFSKLKVEMKKFDQCAEVRNLNVSHNRDNFIDLTVIQMLLNNGIINSDDVGTILTFGSEDFVKLMNTKVKYQYQFGFLASSYYRQWIRDPIKIEQRSNSVNKNCLKFPNHSKNIFKKNKEDYSIYVKLLMQTSCNFIFYFQNNPLKFGKRTKSV